MLLLQMSDANAKAKSALEQARANLEKTAEDLRKAHPDVEQQAGALRDKLQAAVQSTVQVCTVPVSLSLTFPGFITYIGFHFYFKSVLNVSF